MRFFVLAAVFTAIIVGMFYYLEKGDITKHKGVSADEQKVLKHLPRL
jgi:predicted secreted protein